MCAGGFRIQSFDPNGTLSELLGSASLLPVATLVSAADLASRSLSLLKAPSESLAAWSACEAGHSGREKGNTFATCWP